MRIQSASKTVPGLLWLSCATLMLAQPAAALNADYWRGGWRTPLGDEPHIYEFVIRGSRVTGVYCRNCSDATTIGFIDGTWNEKTGIVFTITFATANGSIKSVDDQRAMLVDGRLIVTGSASAPSGKALTLVKDPRGADPGGAPAYHLPPGTAPALPVTRPAAGGGGGGLGSPAPYWQAGPFKTLRPTDVVGTWIASFGLGMNRRSSPFSWLVIGSEAWCAAAATTPTRSARWRTSSSSAIRCTSTSCTRTGARAIRQPSDAISERRSCRTRCSPSFSEKTS
jgi:hypothetical protein